MTDPVTQYALDVKAGNIVAGPHVRAACERHLHDMEHAGERGYVLDTERVDRAISFYSEVLKLNGGDYEGVPFDPLPWQQFIIGSLFGWINKDTGRRRFRVVYVETAKGSGKSPLVGGIGLYGLVADGEQRPEIYAAATKKDQAMILFRDAVAMVRQSPELSARLHLSGAFGREWNIANHSNSGFFRAISSGDGQSGPRPHIVLLDEVHEHKDNSMVEMMRAGTKFRKQALILMITNSGQSLQTVCGEYHDFAIKVSNRSIEDDSFFGYVCALDEGDDPLNDESCWPKANPSLEYGLPGYQYIREQVTQAKGMPSKEAVVKRLNFCLWVASDNPFLSPELWRGTMDDVEPELLIGRRCYGGLDLGSTLDLTALALLFEPTELDPVWRLTQWFWTPGDTLVDREEHDRVPYSTWRDHGHLFAPHGKALNRAHLLEHIKGLITDYDVVRIGYDRYRIEDLLMMISTDETLDDSGLDKLMIPHGQGYKDMAPAVDELERLLLAGDMKHDNNPVMTWCAANAVIVMDPSGNRKLDKSRGYGRIDGIAAAAMASGTMLKSKGEQSPSATTEWITII